MPEYHFVSNEIFTVSEFFTPEECQSYIELAEQTGFDIAPINTVLGPQVDNRIRNNTRVMLDDHERAMSLYQRIVDYIPSQIGFWTACGLNERFRFYRYDVGQQFDWHSDGSFRRDESERSLLTFMVYLNEGFEGGETSFEQHEIVPQQGLALFFEHPILHKGQPIRQGRKYVLRSDVMYRQIGESS